MALGTETAQKPRRPTAFEVSFPYEDDDDKEEDEDAADESQLGKRKYDSGTAGSDGRVRFPLAHLASFQCHSLLVGSVAGETPQPSPSSRTCRGE